MLLVSFAALGLAGMRLVSMFEPEGSETVSPAAFAATPATPVALSGSVRDPDQEPAGQEVAWAAAFGEHDVTMPEPEPEPAAAPEPEPEPEPEQVIEPQIPLEDPEPQESTEYWLTGVIRGNGDSIALVHDGAEEHVAAVGSKLPGGETVVEIGSQSVLARRGDSRFRIVFREDPDTAGATAGQRPEPSGALDAGWDEIGAGTSATGADSAEPEVGGRVSVEEMEARARASVDPDVSGEYGRDVGGASAGRADQARITANGRIPEDWNDDVADDVNRNGNVAE